MGVILTMTLVMMTSMAMTRERERGTLENLLATPVRPLEMMVGKILPYVLIGYAAGADRLCRRALLFGVPMDGSHALLTAAVLLFITATLTVGFTFSTIARSQMQSMQMTMFYFLPNILLSGFMFPFRGMPRWAQALGEVLPLTHFLRIVRGIMLKGAAPARHRDGSAGHRRLHRRWWARWPCCATGRPRLMAHNARHAARHRMIQALTPALLLAALALSGCATVPPGGAPAAPKALPPTAAALPVAANAAPRPASSPAATPTPAPTAVGTPPPHRRLPPSSRTRAASTAR
jgi:hypothetical protein